MYAGYMSYVSHISIVMNQLIGQNQLLKVKNNILESEKDFIEFKEIKLENREAKIKREIENYFLNRLFCLQMM